MYDLPTSVAMPASERVDERDGNAKKWEVVKINGCIKRP